MNLLLLNGKDLDLALEVLENNTLWTLYLDINIFREVLEKNIYKRNNNDIKVTSDSKLVRRLKELGITGGLRQKKVLMSIKNNSLSSLEYLPEEELGKLKELYKSEQKERTVDYYYKINNEEKRLTELQKDYLEFICKNIIEFLGGSIENTNDRFKEFLTRKDLMYNMQQKFNNITKPKINNLSIFDTPIQKMAEYSTKNTIITKIENRSIENIKREIESLKNLLESPTSDKFLNFVLEIDENEIRKNKLLLEAINQLKDKENEQVKNLAQYLKFIFAVYLDDRLMKNSYDFMEKYSGDENDYFKVFMEIDELKEIGFTGIALHSRESLKILRSSVELNCLDKDYMEKIKNSDNIKFILDVLYPLVECECSMI